jgi:cytidylate kinase
VNIIAIVGRTCCGKSSVAQQIAVKLNMQLISVGYLIRKSAQTEKAIAEAYIGANGFPDEFIYGLVAAALEAVKSDWVIMEASIGLGKGLEKLHHNGILNDCVSFWLSCSEEVRWNRYQKRQRYSGRVEHLSFFEDRERLFDRKLGADWGAMRKIGSFHEIDCSLPLEVIVSNVLNVLAFEHGVR